VTFGAVQAAGPIASAAKDIAHSKNSVVLRFLV
jgi:hypothetical protein